MSLSRPSAPDDLPIVDGVAIDVDALRALSHRCDPIGCPVRGACCTHYDVAVDRGELETILGSLDDAERYVPGVRETDVYDEAGPGLFVLETDEDGQCVFAFRPRPRATRLCALHAVALDHNLPPEHVKPSSCALWPLALAETDPMVLSVQDDAYDFPCNVPRPGDPVVLHPGIAEIIAACFGPEFAAQVAALLANPP